MALTDCEKLATHITQWLTDYINQIPSMKGFVVGVSGGIDSALVAMLCAQTNKPTILLNMPIRQHSAEYARACKQIQEIEKNYPNVKGMEINLDLAFKGIEDSLPEDVQNNQLAMANTRSRLRMLTLYALAQENQSLVVGTGNKIEDFGIGFFTKYGDGGVDLNPIGDLLKSEVVELARFVGVIPEILAAKPTDGLWSDSKSDEEQIGASYDELEFIMNLAPDADLSLLSARQLEVKKIYDRLHALNAHKLKAIPICKKP